MSAETSPGFEPDFEVVARFVDLFAKAKWISGNNGVWPDAMLMNLTPLGKRRMQQVVDCSALFFSNPIAERSARRGYFSVFRLIFLWVSVLIELRKFYFSKLELRTFVMIALANVRRSGGPNEPPPVEMPKRYRSRQ